MANGCYIFALLLATASLGFSVASVFLPFYSTKMGFVENDFTAFSLKAKCTDASCSSQSQSWSTIIDAYAAAFCPDGNFNPVIPNNNGGSASNAQQGSSSNGGWTPAPSGILNVPIFNVQVIDPATSITLGQVGAVGASVASALAVFVMILYASGWTVNRWLSVLLLLPGPFAGLSILGWGSFVGGCIDVCQIAAALGSTQQSSCRLSAAFILMFFIGSFALGAMICACVGINSAVRAGLIAAPYQQQTTTAVVLLASSGPAVNAQPVAYPPVYGAQQDVYGYPQQYAPVPKQDNIYGAA